MNRIWNGWTLPRVFYFLIGGLIFIQSLFVMEWLGIIFGGYFTAMGLFGFGCAAGQCYPRRFVQPKNENNTSLLENKNQ